MADLPLIMTQAGPQPTSPAILKEALLAIVEGQSAGYTARLPGILIEDISSTDVAAMAQCDAARVDTVNSLTPYGANAFLLLQMGQMTGVNQQPQTNSSVQMVFTGTPNYVVSPGFTVTDGAYQYYALDGGIVGAAPSGGTVGTSGLITFIATVSGSWAIPANTVTEISTSIPSTVTMTCTNPNPGTPGIFTQTEASYRAQVLQAWSASAQGTPSFIKTLVGNVTGVDPRLISVQQTGALLKVIVGGSYDQNSVAYALYRGAGDPSALTGSTNSTRNNVVQITDYPDVYLIPFVSPPQQVITATVIWNTTAAGFVNVVAIQQLAAPALADYVNQIAVGRPLNILEMQAAFKTAIAGILAGPLLSRLVFEISINGVGVLPAVGLEIIPGDSEGYFWSDPSGIGFMIEQG